ncbi:hypothetical protein Nepgr_005646 [Nepenthes gracilis]|uniref:AP2/ERF domain-containing protein n=1 Tax=Nepenthes gracilis TaxID=150966 RepID=A0AAD3XGM6_NEPGR|nr:hypothetical protein Nepgr_005646 [Nepenthes gracilis]
MSNWLGFSLTPHLRIDEDQDPPPPPPALTLPAPSSPSFSPPNDMPVIRLRSDGSLCALNPFRRTEEWGYENSINGNEGPKLENFLGCYSTSPSNDSKVFCQDKINVNSPPNFSSSNNGESLLQNDDKLLTTYPSYHETHQQQSNIISNGSTEHHQNFGQNAAHSSPICPVPFDGATSVSGFKSWLRQNPFSEDHKGSLSGNSNGGLVNRRNFEALSLTMSHGESGIVLPLEGTESRKRAAGKTLNGREPVPRKSIDTFGQRTSQYRGVTRHRWTGRYEAHLWDNSCRKEGQTRKGRQGGYDKEEKAARAYDLAALKYWGPTTHINFPLSAYEKELEEMKNMTRQEFVAHLRRQSSGFSRGASIYRGVTSHLLLGTQEEAAEAYDIAAIKFRGTSAVTNFEISRYDVKRICSSLTLSAGDIAKRSPRNHAAALSGANDSGDQTTVSSHHHPPLAITNGEVSDGFADMWNDANVGDASQNECAGGNGNSCTPASPRCAVNAGSEFGNIGGDYSQAYFSLPGEKYEDGRHSSGGVEDNGGGERLRNLGLLPHAPMFALWND